MHKTSDYHYTLPPELIAQHPARQRDASRMMVLDRGRGAWSHRGIGDLPDFLRAGDLLVLNNTRVIPARMYGRKVPSGGRVEVLFLEERAPDVWEVLLRASRRPRTGGRMLLGSRDQVEAEMLEEGEMGLALLRIQAPGSLLDVLEQEGTPPLPPYIQRPAPVAASDADEDRRRYQTIYASRPGAVAAPTAGLHFTSELFEALASCGIHTAEITLHVGLGTFRPVTAARLTDHRMHEERYEISEEAALAIARTRAARGRIVAVGSTSVRTLETAAAAHEGEVVAGQGRSALFIHPPFHFRVVDAMLTNFHLPESTLLMMVCALAGMDLTMRAYQAAIEHEYRFFSYGDCMLIL